MKNKKIYLRLLAEETIDKMFNDEIEKLCYYYDRNRRKAKKLLMEQGSVSLKKGDLSSVYKKPILPSQYIAAILRTAGKYGKIQGYSVGQMTRINADDRLIKINFAPVGDVNNKNFVKLRLLPMNFYVGLYKDSISEFIIVSERYVLKNKGMIKKIMNKSKAFIDNLIGRKNQRMRLNLNPDNVSQMNRSQSTRATKIFALQPVRVIGFNNLASVVNLLMKNSENLAQR